MPPLREPVHFVAIAIAGLAHRRRSQLRPSAPLLCDALSPSSFAPNRHLSVPSSPAALPAIACAAHQARHRRPRNASGLTPSSRNPAPLPSAAEQVPSGRDSRRLSAIRPIVAGRPARPRVDESMRTPSMTTYTPLDSPYRRVTLPSIVPSAAEQVPAGRETLRPVLPRQCKQAKQRWRTLLLEEVRLKLLNCQMALKMPLEIFLLSEDNELKTISLQ
nr:uncharacterized protein LOC127306910 [Lolium perenne]XP_051193574.1 uncharacterized protein LOC127306910 [Lolium perenne]